MDIGLINQENLNLFRTLLLPEAVEALEHNRPVLVLGLTSDQVACGAAAAYAQDGVLEITSLFVAPDYRRQGGGSLLLNSLCQLAKTSCHTVELSFTVTRPEHRTLERVLRLMGFSMGEQEDKLWGLTLGQIASSDFFHRGEDIMSGLTPFCKVPEFALRQAYQSAAAQSANYLPCHLDQPPVDQDVSLAVLKGGEVQSFVAFTDHPGRVDLAWLQSGNPLYMAKLLCGAFRVIRHKFSDDTLVTMLAVNSSAGQLIHTLIPQAEVLSRRYILALEPDRAYLSGQED